MPTANLLPYNPKMKQSIFPKRRLGISWDVKTRMMQVEDKDHRVTTFFNVSEEDFELFRASKFPRFSFKQLVKSQKFPYDIELIS